MKLDIINEDTTAYLTASFTDKNGNADAPSTAYYRIDCLTTGQKIKEDTALTPASSIEITLSAADNAIKTQTNRTEHRLVTVWGTYSGSESVKNDYEYILKNLRKVPSPA